ncbi:MAG: TonB family protein, partial [Acidobacteriota bacterium]|nr:TonB family protein [Acidobacteriota bacterium]
IHFERVALTMKSRSWAGAVGVLLLWSSLPVMGGEVPKGGTPAGSEELLRQGKQLLKERKFKAAAEAFGKANRAADGQCGECLAGLGRAQLGVGNLDEAIASMRQAAGLLSEPRGLSQTYDALGTMLTRRGKKGDLEEAEEVFGKALETGGANRSVVLSNRAEVRRRLVHYAEAVEAARQSLQEAPDGEAAGQARIALCLSRLAGKLPGHGEAADSRGDAGLASAEGHLLPPDGVPGVLRIGDVVEGETVKMPMKLHVQGPHSQAVNGVVVIGAIIDAEGCVTDVTILRKFNSTLDQEAMVAVKSWVFKPAQLAGKPVKVFYAVTVNFVTSLLPN